MKPYTYEKKKKLANKISEIRKKHILCEIFDIILTNNPNLLGENQFQANRNGIFVYFHNLVDKTYHQINTYLMENKMKSIESDTLSPLSP